MTKLHNYDTILIYYYLISYDCRLLYKCNSLQIVEDETDKASRFLKRGAQLMFRQWFSFLNHNITKILSYILVLSAAVLLSIFIGDVLTDWKDAIMFEQGWRGAEYTWFEVIMPDVTFFCILFVILVFLFLNRD